MRLTRGRILVVYAGLIGIGLLAVFFVHPEMQKQRYIKQLYGQWQDGPVTLLIQKNEMILIQPDHEGNPRTTRMLVRYMIDVHPKRFATIDAALPNTGQDNVCPGIFELNGDTLRLCVGLPGQGFPEDFDPLYGSILELQRVE